MGMDVIILRLNRLVWIQNGFSQISNLEIRKSVVLLCNIVVRAAPHLFCQAATYISLMQKCKSFQYFMLPISRVRTSSRANEQNGRWPVWLLHLKYSALCIRFNVQCWHFSCKKKFFWSFYIFYRDISNICIRFYFSYCIFQPFLQIEFQIRRITKLVQSFVSWYYTITHTHTTLTWCTLAYRWCRRWRRCRTPYGPGIRPALAGYAVKGPSGCEIRPGQIAHPHTAVLGKASLFVQVQRGCGFDWCRWNKSGALSAPVKCGQIGKTVFANINPGAGSDLRAGYEVKMLQIY